MSYVVPTDAYWNPGPVAYPDEPHEPVPGWGMRPNMTGPRLVGVGGLGATQSPDSVEVELGHPPIGDSDVGWTLGYTQTLGALKAKWDSASAAFDAKEYVKQRCGAAIAFGTGCAEAVASPARIVLDIWAQREAASAKAGNKAAAAAYAYAQAVLWLSFATFESAIFPNAYAEAAIAAKRGFQQRTAALGGHVYTAAKTATIQGKPRTSWAASIKAPPATKPASQEAAPPPQEVEQEDQGHMVLWIVIGVVAVGGAAAYALTRK